MTTAIYRILDASFNRIGEGFRTLEDYARFALNDALLAESAKGLRHDLATAASQLPRRELLAARDTPGDVGTDLQTSGEQTRAAPASVAVAAATRCQQALRSAEEYAKCISPNVAVQLEKIRYQTYTLAAAIETLPDRCNRLADRNLYALINGADGKDSFLKNLRSLAEGGVDIFQLRDKQLSDRELFEYGSAAMTALRQMPGQRPLLIINDRADIAIACQADGVHVGQDELPLASVRKMMPPASLIGVSTHSYAQAETAVLGGADYIGCGPTFPSQTKTFDEFPGLDFLKQIAASISLPAFAIGGINQENLNQVLQTGIRRIAVTAALQSAAAPQQAAAALKQSLSKAQ
ncbi:Thiamine-phosphate synthase [Roseimaritima multifibrata]|uniref:Thiamine-phosphate synthase n=1 Tax=Roseimaritima multifibrata TaxID=1930274 RepID=A0A517MNC4_9BACT|nr:thiamine phosphate synthase [Roseimaritima multifibrata]QDS96382.1 Thiamine-phosphate synthase [Roseimaritima multifibrata]